VVLAGLTPWLPEVALVPVKALDPEAVHEVALADDQVSVLLEPLVIEAGLALRLTVGAALVVTVTVTERLALPPAPVQVRV
jgi:hypothetical protein